MDRKQSVVTPERFAAGMTFDEYVKFIGSPENLAREGLDIRRAGPGDQGWSTI